MSRVSAIVTCYNVEPWVATAMQSVIDAGFDDLQLIVVDDGSNDATRRIADLVGHAAPADRVQYEPLFFSQNTIGGVGTAANAGMDRADGDIVVFVDGDDWVVPHALRQAVQQLDETGADFTVCGCQEYWNNSGNFTTYPEGKIWASLRKLSGKAELRNALLQMAPFPWRKIYRRDFLERHKIRFPIGDFFFEDNPFHWETSVRAERFNFFEPVTHIHRMERAGQTVHAMGLRPIQIFEHAGIIRRKLEQLGQKEALQERYFQWLVDHILWCGRYVSPQGLNTVYDKSRAALREYSDEVFWEQLSKKDRSLSDVRQMVAIRLDDRLGYLREIKD